MPTERPNIFIGDVRLILLHDFTRFDNGSMLMRVADCNVEIIENGNPIGALGTAMGGAMYIVHGDRMWHIDTTSLWKAFLAAEKAQYLREGR